MREWHGIDPRTPAGVGTRGHGRRARSGIAQPFLGIRHGPGEVQFTDAPPQ